MRTTLIDKFVNWYLMSPSIALVTVSPDHRFVGGYFVEERVSLHIAEALYAASMLGIEVALPTCVARCYEGWLEQHTLVYNLALEKTSTVWFLNRGSREKSKTETLFSKAYEPFTSGRSGTPFFTMLDAQNAFASGLEFSAWCFSVYSSIDNLNTHFSNGGVSVSSLPSANATHSLYDSRIIRDSERDITKDWDMWATCPDDLQEAEHIYIPPYQRHTLLVKYGLMGTDISKKSGVQRFVFESMDASLMKIPSTVLKT